MSENTVSPADLSATIQLAAELIRIRSVTPDDNGCNQVMINRLVALGFRVEELRYGEVNNFWARYGNDGPLLCFAGHTDVVPSGPERHWQFPPFQPTVHSGQLYGRGAADMKGSLAAMVTACERFLRDCQHNGHTLNGSLGFLITADEEGEAVDGTRKVVEHLQARNENITWCIVGEPSSTDRLGDVIKVGRRGSLHGHLTVHGIQGHVAYPHLARNPIHQALLPLAALVRESWDDGNDAFPPTTFQISNINSGTGADNVVPGLLTARFNFRFSTALTEAVIRQRTHAILDSHQLDYSLEWQLSGQPFLTESGDLIRVVQQSVADINGVQTETSTSGGTSDGRFIAPGGAQVVELGPCNATIHKVDEHVSVDDLDQLSAIYERVMARLLLTSPT